jgi:hypothetical protein
MYELNGQEGLEQRGKTFSKRKGKWHMEGSEELETPGLFMEVLFPSSLMSNSNWQPNQLLDFSFARSKTRKSQTEY